MTLSFMMLASMLLPARYMAPRLQARKPLKDSRANVLLLCTVGRISTTETYTTGQMKRTASLRLKTTKSPGF
jgi:hypothetical protein